MKDRTWVATLDDGSQILVEYWAQDDCITVATRTDKWSIWSPQTSADEKSWDGAA
jgi:hypothetical protein